MYGIPKFDSESFELELNGMPGGTSGSSFGQNPLVFLEITFRPMYTCIYKRTTCTLTNRANWAIIGGGICARVVAVFFDPF